MTIIRVKPAEGLIIRAPDGQIIPPEGAHLARDMYAQRRLAQGDLVEVPEEPEPVPQNPPRLRKGADA